MSTFQMATLTAVAVFVMLAATYGICLILAGAAEIEASQQDPEHSSVDE